MLSANEAYIDHSTLKGKYFKFGMGGMAIKNCSQRLSPSNARDKVILSWAEEDAADVDVWIIVHECAVRARVAMATDSELVPKLRMLRTTWIIQNTRLTSIVWHLFS